MNNKICIFGDALCFNASGDLEKYRVESALDKEPETIAWIDAWSTAAGPGVFFDIGANMGIYSLYAAYRHPALAVYAFEPVSNNYTALQQNVWLNQWPNVHPFNLALAKENKITELFLSDTRVGNSGAQIVAAVNEKGEYYEALRVEKVLGVSLDRLIGEFGLPVPNFVKIDVDGHETDILNGMQQTLSAPALKSLLVEFNNDEEYAYWRSRLETAGLQVDTRYDKLPNHSRLRRVSKGTPARNYIFSRA
ncbi:FkbM family methyltransferase [Sphingorhabdus sp.]|uniref:FkbM family methyltransferase n=1 Tax=Sphingorhabdus sp. TaxID=1902408 RepID=UPI0035B07891